MSAIDVERAMDALKGPGLALPDAESLAPSRPGLYAVHAESAAWVELGLGEPPDSRPLYVGKSESSLATRDIRTHFSDGRTGSSTLRRSLAAQLAPVLDLHARPRNPRNPERFANYGLSAQDDTKLTRWMRANLRLSFCAAEPGLGPAAVEAEALQRLKPPLNISGVVTPWTEKVKGARARMAAEARRWKP